MDSPIAIILLSYNHLEQTRQALSSLNLYLEAYKFSKPQYHPLLVHNGSRPEIVAKLMQEFPHIEHVVMPVNRGFSGGMNKGFDHAFERFDHALALTNDISVMALPKEIPAGISAATIFRRKTSMVDSCGAHLNLWSGKLRHLRTQEEFTRLHRTRGFYVPGTAFAVDKKTWQLLNGFDESFFCLWEDVDWSLRARDMKVDFHLLSDFQLLHKVGKTMHRHAYYTSYLFLRNQRLTLQKHTPSRTMAWSQHTFRLWHQMKSFLRTGKLDRERLFWLDKSRDTKTLYPQSLWRP